MAVRLVVHDIGDLPRLGWLALIDRAAGAVVVWKGASVEAQPGWVVEGVWTGAFEEAAFHAAEHFFGSGVRVVDGEVWLAASSSTCDRLLVCEDGDRVYASNSLPLLLAYTGAELAAGHDYRIQAFAQDADLGHYSRDYPVTHPTIERFLQVFQERVIIGEDGVRFKNLHRPRDFSHYAEYVDALRRALAELDANITSEHRRLPLRKFSTISTGYDSTAVTALVREIGVEGCFSFPRSNTGIPRLLSRRAVVDDGTRIAERLGVSAIPLQKPRRGRVDRDELHFLSASAAPAEMAFYEMHRRLLERDATGVVFTGHHGGSIWGSRLADRTGDVVVKGDLAGLNLTEARLHGGFIHVPVPALFLWSAPSLYRLARAPDMEPWRVGGEYDRPVPRRILEEAGVPGEWFGYRKKAVVQAYDAPYNEELRTAFERFLAERLGYGGSRLGIAALRARRRLGSVVARGMDRLGIDGGSGPGTVNPDEDLPYLLFKWAVARDAFEKRRVLIEEGVPVLRFPSADGD